MAFTSSGQGKPTQAELEWSSETIKAKWKVTLFNSAKYKSEFSFSTPLNTWAFAPSQACQFRLDSAKWKPLQKASYHHLNLSPHFLLFVNSSSLGLLVLTIILVLFLISQASTMISHMEEMLDLNFNIIRIKLCWVLQGLWWEHLWVCWKTSSPGFSACIGQYYWAAFFGRGSGCWDPKMKVLQQCTVLLIANVWCVAVIESRTLPQSSEV